MRVINSKQNIKMKNGDTFHILKDKLTLLKITKNIINYDAPVRFCPTKDNSYVDIDIHFTFRLPQTDDLVKTFVYKLGAGRFDELLVAEVEENTRIFINSIICYIVFKFNT